MNITQDVVARYREKGLAIFPLRLLEEYNDRHQKWKKKIDAQGAWNHIDKHSKLVILKKHNAIGILTGSKSGVFVLDIDSLEHWIEWLKSHKRYDDWMALEKTLVTAQTASGGFHYYFLFTLALVKMKGTSKCFGGHWEIDSRTTGNFVYAPPTRLVNNNVNWEYKWVRSIFDHPLVEMPDCIVQWLDKRPGNYNNSISAEAAPRVAQASVSDVRPSSTVQHPLSEHRSQQGALIEAIVRLIDISKWDKYNDWLAIGINLKSLVLPEGEKFDIFKVVSQISDEYQEGCCETKWNKIPVNDHSAAESILRSWARQGDPIAYGSLTGEKPIEAHHMAIIKGFVSAQFHFGIHRIGDGIVKTYDDTSYILVNVKETYCTLFEGEHDETQFLDGVQLERPYNPYVVVGEKHARLKCHNSTCASKHGKDLPFSKYTKEMKKVVEELLTARQEISEHGMEPLVGAGKDYESVKVEFEKEWFALCYPAVYVQIKRETIRYYSLSAIKHSAKFVTFESVRTDRRGSKQVEEQSFLDKWLNDPKQRHYDTLDFIPPPLECPPDLFNTFHGFAAEILPPVPDDIVIDFQPIMTLLYDLCDHQDAPKEYVLSWLAHMIQLPAILPRTGVIFKSKEGRGKNMLFGTLFGENILGRSLYKTSAKVDDFFGRFANGFVHRILCNFNEVSAKHTSSIMGAVKETITEPVLSYEKKGADVVEIRNCARQLWFSNEDIPIKLSQDDRRWIAIQAAETMPDTDSPEHLAYFGRVKEWIDDDRNVRAFYDFLRTRDITHWKPDVRPRTSFYTELQRLNLNRVEQWLVNRLETCSLPPAILSKQLAEELVRSDTRAPPVSSNWVTPKMRVYQGRGVVFSDNQVTIKSGEFKGRGRGYYLDAKALLKTFVEMNIMAPLFLDDDDDDK
jgi:hypothetical protein